MGTCDEVERERGDDDADERRIFLGRIVKIAFPTRNDPEIAAERMWVVVDQVTPEGLSGTLDNDPTCDVGYVYGDRVTFTVDQIMAVESIRVMECTRDEERAGGGEHQNPERAAPSERTVATERAARHERTAIRERAETLERTIRDERAEACESTRRRERAAIAESTEQRERAGVGESTISRERAVLIERTEITE